MNKFRHHQALTEEQIALLQKVRGRVLAAAEAFDMRFVAYECGAPACIAGHCAVELGVGEGGLVEVERWFGAGQALDYVPLFYLGHWDKDLRLQYRSTESEQERALAGCKAIDRYIANTIAEHGRVE